VKTVCNIRTGKLGVVTFLCISFPHKSENRLHDQHTEKNMKNFQNTFVLFQTDAHNYKIIGILKQLKFHYRSDTCTTG